MPRPSRHPFAAEVRDFVTWRMRAHAGRFGAACLLALLAAAQQTHAQDRAQADAQHALPSASAAPTNVDELEKVLRGERPLTPVERRTVEIIREAAQPPGAAADYPQPIGEQRGTPGEAEENSRTTLAASPAAENVRDPCLVSWDPSCYAKHAADYDPRWGYAPSVLRSRTGSPGETSTVTQPPGGAP
jgi:hypothetical protein